MKKERTRYNFLQIQRGLPVRINHLEETLEQHNTANPESTTEDLEFIIIDFLIDLHHLVEFDPGVTASFEDLQRCAKIEYTREIRGLNQ